MNPRAAQLIRDLGLEPHPEGGFFAEVFRSPERVAPADGRPARSALTTICFLLPRGSVSRLHAVASDEAWHHYEGAPLELMVLDARLTRLQRLVLGPVEDGSAPVHVVPAGCWQGARSLGDYTLVGCTVGPGFEFDDFRMLGSADAEAERVVRRFPDLRDFLVG